ncbi:MAG: RpiB/LacA/LacB family sugar-phosphate isomerase [Candidatus Neomarinimicrobiota bacterium]
MRRAHREGKPLRAEEGAILTPSARDAVRALNVEVIHAGVAAEQSGKAPAFRVVGVASDHGGVLAKQWACRTLEELGVEYRDHGVASAEETVDYPDKAAEIAAKVQAGTYWRGIIIDGAGIGSAIVANKFADIRAGLVYDTLTATNARAHNNVNIITLGGQMLGEKTVQEIVTLFIRTEFEGGRHQARVDKMQRIDQQERG